MQTQSILNSTEVNLYWDQLAQGSVLLVVDGKQRDHQCAMSVNTWARSKYFFMARSLRPVQLNPERWPEGFYLNLFMVASYTLFHRKIAGRRVLLAFTWAMAVLGTTQMVLRLITNFTEAHLFLRVIRHSMVPDAASTFSPSMEGTLNSLNLAQNAIFGINKFVILAFVLF
jgi:hypothetical protein